MSFPSVKNSFFSAVDVAEKLDPATRRALSKFGAFVRQRDRSSLKYHDGAAPPGRPPYVHRSKSFTRKARKKGKVIQQPASPLRELTFFSYDPARKSVVIGPAISAQHTGAPRTIEQGGDATVNGQHIHVRPRPHTGPAFRAELEKVDGYFMNILDR
jgi:hypothetical protein